MNKANIRLDVLKKLIARLVKAAPARKPEPPEPLNRLVRAFLEYDCDEARTEAAEKKILSAMVDSNELRVTPAIELAALLGVRYPFAESRCSALHRTLQSIFDREHQMRLDRVREMKKGDIRPYLQSLGGITPYVEAVVSLEAFGIAAVPVDMKLVLWLVGKDALPEGTDVRMAQQVLEKHVKAGEMLEFHLGARKEIDDWAPKSWPPVAKVASPVLAPPPLDSRGDEIVPPHEAAAAKEAPKDAAKDAKAVKVEARKPEPVVEKKPAAAKKK